MKSLSVFLAGTECGVLEQSPQGNLTFRYLADYPVAATPISISMPPRAEAYPKAAILPFLQGLLPDNESALQAIGSRFGISYRNPFAILSKIGADVAGALQFLSERPRTRVEPQELSTESVERLLQEKIVEYSSAIPGSGAGLFSLAGAQPKLALVMENGTWSTGGTDFPTTHILKPMPIELPDVDLVELLTMETARQLGLRVSGARFASIGNLRVLVVERYDRQLKGNKVVRLHQEDFLQAMSISPQNKYQKTQGGPGLKRISQLFKMIPGVSREAVVQDFFAGFSLNIMLRATDAHAKNYSLLLDGTNVRLAPLYDLISGAYFPQAQESAIAVGGHYRFDSISDGMLVDEGENLGVKDPGNIVASLRESLPGAIKEASNVVIDELPRNLAKRSQQISEAMLKLL